MSCTAALAADFARLDLQVKAAEAEVEKLTAKKNLLGDLLAKAYEDEGLTSLTVDVDGKPFVAYQHNQYWAKRKNGAAAEDVYDALITAGLEDLATRSYNTQSVSAYLRELKKDDENAPLPDALTEVLDFSKVTKIQVRKK